MGACASKNELPHPNVGVASGDADENRIVAESFDDINNCNNTRKFSLTLMTPMGSQKVQPSQQLGESTSRMSSPRSPLAELVSTSIKSMSPRAAWSESGQTSTTFSRTSSAGLRPIVISPPSPSAAASKALSASGSNSSLLMLESSDSMSLTEVSSKAVVISSLNSSPMSSSPMVIPKADIFWSRIASSWLEIEDLARFECALNSRALRAKLGLELPAKWENIQERPASRSLTSPSMASSFKPWTQSPYESLCDHGFTQDVELSSRVMYTWCERRRFRLKSVRLSFLMYPINRRGSPRSMHSRSTTYDNLADSGSPRSPGQQLDWDLLEHIEKLSINVSSTNASYIFPRFKNLTSFSHPLTMEDQDVASLVEICNDNHHRIERPTSLSRLSINPTTSHVMGYFIMGLSTVTTLELTNAAQLTDTHLQLMAKRWKLLKSLDICLSNVTDTGFEGFAREGRSLRDVWLHGCPNVTFVGVKSLLAFSTDSLQTLGLTDMDAMPESQIVALLSKGYSQLSSFEWADPSCSDAIIHAVARHCPRMKMLKLMTYRSRISDDDILLLTLSCPSIEVLWLCYFRDLTALSLAYIADAYKNTLREVVLEATGLSLGEAGQQLLTPCRFKVTATIS